MELNVDKFWTDGYDVTTLDNEKYSMLWSLIHNETWVDGIFPIQQVASWSNTTKENLKDRVEDISPNLTMWNVPVEYDQIMNDIWHSDYYQKFFREYAKKVGKIEYIDVWNKTPAHEWHSHTPDNVDLVLLIYLNEQEQWKHEWGGVLQVGTKTIETNKVANIHSILPNNKTVVLINNINPRIFHSVTEQISQNNRYTIGAGIKLWN